MKKKLEADLMSIAHRVLQMKNKSDINQLCIETQKLYEKLSILRFVEEHFGGAKPTIGQAEIIEKMKQFFEENHLSEVKPSSIQEEIVVDEVVPEEITVLEEIVQQVDEDEIEKEIEEGIDEEVVATIESEEEIVAPLEEETSEVDFLPTYDLEKPEDVEEIKKTEAVQISFEDLMGSNYEEPLFVKVDPNKDKGSPLDFELPKINFQEEKKEPIAEIPVKPKEIETKIVSTIDKPLHGISIGLNDRVAFVKHLFGNSDEDYNRVLNQLITFDSFEEAQNFVEDMVKPDYNNWEGKEDYEKRFIQIIEKKFA